MSGPSSFSAASLIVGLLNLEYWDLTSTQEHEIELKIEPGCKNDQIRG